ncbi:hypothetical protein [Pseudomonas sp. PD9R]|uniref:hypothetical protein n=1 Tax=Pseudomonas sp. PD9R TaxID=2853534 RepID=UPI001C47D536|nr:hypothetical protein [Pseudomonas sp. PD9R]MBV6826965.1 hypothetical protein [Pseudomonas sp. PD9R]
MGEGLASIGMGSRLYGGIHVGAAEGCDLLIVFLKKQDQKIAAFGSSLYLDYRSVRSDSSRLIIEGGTWKPRSSLGFLPAM